MIRGRVRATGTFLPLAGLAVLAACVALAPPSPGPEPSTATPAAEHLILTPVTFGALPGWHDDMMAQSLPALRRSCDRLSQLPPSQPVGEDGLAGLVGDWLAPCGALRQIAAGDHQGLRIFLENWFLAYRASNGTITEGRFTGYFEPELRGSRRQTATYRVPLYTRPPGLALDPGEHYFSRTEIEGGVLRGKTAALLWLDDAVDAHILHIQGSGRIHLDDGTTVRVGYDGSNGKKFVGLGAILRDHDKVAAEAATMPAVRVWLKSHPVEAPALMAENPRYIFFRLISGDGPVGAAGVALTPGRSLAVDPHFVPLGVPVWLSSNEPDGSPLRRLMVAQDTGAAIKGPVRGDVFWGAGETAFDKAGRMKSRGIYYLLLPRQRSGVVATAAAPATPG
jgi:membrane-bound lytic murein transglycosylase A